MENTAGPRSALVWDDVSELPILRYPSMNPVRLKLTHRLAKMLGVLDGKTSAGQAAGRHRRRVSYGSFDRLHRAGAGSVI